MAHNQELLDKNTEKWGSKVRILGLSIDDEASTVKSHVDSKGWGKVEHYQCGGETTAQEDFGVEGVPHIVLIDTYGKIVFIGHPSQRDLEKDIDTLLNGNKLDTETGDQSTEAPESKENYSDMNEAITKFKLEVQKFMDDYKEMWRTAEHAYMVLID